METSDSKSLKYIVVLDVLMKNEATSIGMLDIMKAIKRI